MKFNFGKKMKKVIQNWLQIVPASEQSIVLMESTGFITDVIRSQLWYRGDSSELFQFFHQIDNGLNSFWGSVPSNEKIRKIHSGLPAIIVDTLAYMVKSDLDNIKINQTEKNWNIISKKINFKSLIGKSVCDTLVEGDGAFKISVDSDVSPAPVVEFYGADKVEYSYSRGILKEIIFHSEYKTHNRKYYLEEHYGKGYINSILYDSNGYEVSIDSVPCLADIAPHIVFSGDYIMAVPLKFYESKKYANRGKSIFDGGKSDCFDALDEVISQWWDAIRTGRVQKYIPADKIPRNPDNGALQRVNSFGTEFIELAPALGDDKASQIQVIQPDIRYDAFVSSYTNCLLMCLQGLVSPATLGIDVGKMSSADAQREKKDVTGNTRNTITTALEKALPELVSAVLKTYDNMQGKAPENYDVTVSFGEYGAPDFDSRVETIGKASTYGIMS
ncbi:MAG TPA: capsid protein, partial [Ruminococcus sp.]|nr:capsid protein [Ruminococcus sp.]